MLEGTASRTAEFMALFRALETCGPSTDRLFEDPHAAAFLPGTLWLVVQLARVPGLRSALCRLIDLLWPGARLAGVARTRLIDDVVHDCLGRGLDQVVILGVGFDSRAYRLPGLEKARVFEVDHPSTLRERRNRLAKLPVAPAGDVVDAPTDFDRSSPGDALKQAGLDPTRPTLFVLEGVTNYLTAEGVDALLRVVSSAAPGTRLIFTYVHRDAIESPDRYAGTWLLRRTLHRAREPWSFGIDPAQLPAFLRERGLDLVWDEGSKEYRQRLLGDREQRTRGYEFYRAALAAVAGGRRDAQG